MQTNSLILKVSGKKIAALLVLFAVSALGAYATLGDGDGKKVKSNKSLLSVRTTVKPGAFSLNSGYSFRGSQVMNFQEKYINLNTIVTYQQGHTTYVLPMKKKVSLNLTTQNKVSGATVKIKF